MNNLSVAVHPEEVDGDNLPVETSDKVLELVKSINSPDAIQINLVFPDTASCRVGNREGIMGWYKPRGYKINNTHFEISKIVFLQEMLHYERGYIASANHCIGDNFIKLDCKRIESPSQLEASV